MHTICLRGIRNAWHFHYALVLVIKVVCGDFVLRCSLLSLALVCKEQKSVCGLTSYSPVISQRLFIEIGISRSPLFG
ncbi:DUF3265 domain-containing protein [Vibrio kanaloae]|nr:DUF3265 domain-containing protein [Vibrio kanaloae]